jgi:hypothetical protein
MAQPTSPGDLNAGPDNSLPLPPTLLRELSHALRTIRYGAVELVIHDGRVVQLELREKVRFEPDHSRGDLNGPRIRTDRTAGRPTLDSSGRSNA